MSVVEDVLTRWREAERLLGRATERTDRERLEVAIDQLRGIYADLTGASGVSARKIQRATLVMKRANRVLDEARARLEDRS